MDRSAVLAALRGEMRRLGREPRPGEVSLELYAEATRLFGRWRLAIAAARGEHGRNGVDQARARTRLVELETKPERRDGLEMMLSGRLRYGAWPSHGLRRLKTG